jgi:hypothetical protein
MTAAQFEALLRTSLELWQVEAELQSMADGNGPSAALQARLSLADGTSLIVAEAGPHEEPFRWWLLWHGPESVAAAPTDAPMLRRKPCASTLGLLRSLREALGVPAVGKVRVGTGAGIGSGIDDHAGERTST